MARNEHSPEVLLSEATIAQRIVALASRISADYANTDELIMVGVLRGAYIFLADLSRKLTIPRRIDFIAVSTYGEAAESSGSVRLVMDLRVNIAGRDVLVVEDIVDRGHTLRYLMDMLATRGPRTLRSCVLVRKAAAGNADVRVDYLGFEIPDVWAVGYGLDYKDKYRALPYIGKVGGEQ